MRIDVLYQDRVGLGEAVLMVIARRQLNVSQIEVEPEHIYIDVPALEQPRFDELSQALRDVPGVLAVTVAEILPGVRRRLYLEALLAGMSDPVLAVDGDGRVVVGNAAAAALAGGSANTLAGCRFGELYAAPELHGELVAAGFSLPPREVSLCGQTFLLDARPLAEAEPAAGSGPAPVAGGLLTLHAPSRISRQFFALQHAEAPGFDRILGESPAIRDLRQRAARVAGVEAPLMILGETGTGKELLAHACHAASRRAGAPFLALNCAAVPENLAESELFGYAPGAFSGAQRGGKPGLLELAAGGTVFLDEIGEMSLYLQAKLLRFLNDGSYRRVGGERELRVDVRIVCATHRPLEQMVGERSFREDLYYRLNVLTLKLPPLRERGDDILLLAEQAIERAAAQAGKARCRLTPDAVAALRQAAWPGNVRQLQNVIFRAVTLSDQAWLSAADLELAGSAVAAQGGSEQQPVQTTSAIAADADWEQLIGEREREILAALYPQHPSSRKLAARLGVSHSKIAAKLKKWGIG